MEMGAQNADQQGIHLTPLLSTANLEVIMVEDTSASRSHRNGRKTRKNRGNGYEFDWISLTWMWL